MFRYKSALCNRWIRKGRSGLVRDEQETLGKIIFYNFRDWPNSRFVFTLTSLGYQLQKADKSPVFRGDGIKGLVVSHETSFIAYSRGNTG